MKTPKEYIDEVYGQFVIKTKSYPGTIPDELSDWYVYLRDTGHNVICLMEQDLKDAFLYDEFHLYMTPLPVKFVISRYYLLPNGFVVIPGVNYDPNSGVDVAKGFEEM